MSFITALTWVSVVTPSSFSHQNLHFCFPGCFGRQSLGSALPTLRWPGLPCQQDDKVPDLHSHFVNSCQGTWWAEQGCGCCCCEIHSSSQGTGYHRELFLPPLTFNMKNNWLFKPYYWTLKLLLWRIIISIVLFYFSLPHILFVLLYKIQEYKLSKKIMNWGQINDYHCLGNKIGHYKLIEVCGFSCLLIAVG